MRYLPVYFLLDISDSMAGEPVAAVQRGLDSIIAILRNDPYALETMRLSTLVFAGRAEVHAPLTDLVDFRMRPLPIGGGTSLGAGLELLMRRMDKEVAKNTPEKKGDWKPLVFLFTDGVPTDQPDAAIERWNKYYRKGAQLVIATFGDHADMELLRRISDITLTLQNTTPQAFSEFFRWVSASLRMSSCAVSGGGDGPRLAEYCINLAKSPAKGREDENFAALPMRCSAQGKFWLAKYGRGESGWNYIGSYPVDAEAYGRLTGNTGEAAAFELAEADIMPQCPICHGDNGVVRCHCGGLSCSPENALNAVCPWCGRPFGQLRETDAMSVARSRG